MLIKMYLMTLFQVMNPHKRRLQPKVKSWNEPKQGKYMHMIDYFFHNSNTSTPEVKKLLQHFS